MRIRYLGHSSFSIECKNTKVLLDPFLSGNPKCEIDPESVECDVMLLSHGHQDHILDAVSIAERTGCLVISNFEIITWLADQGIKNGHGMNHGGTYKGDFGWLKSVNAVHSSSFPDGSYAGNPGGFILSDGTKIIYYAGDTALHMDMELIGRHHSLDMAILPVGDTYTMGYKDAAIACEMVGSSKAIGMHYDSFPVLELDREAAQKSFEKRNKELILMDIGSEIEL